MACPGPLRQRSGRSTTVLVYVAAISIGAGILFGLAPAYRLSKIGVHAALKDGGLVTSGRSARNRIATVLVVTEMALTVMLRPLHRRGCARAHGILPLDEIGKNSQRSSIETHWGREGLQLSIRPW